MTETTATDTPTTSAPDWDRASEVLHAALSRLAIAMGVVHYRRAADDVRLPVELLREDVSDAMRALGLDAPTAVRADPRCEHEAGDNGMCFGCGAAFVQVMPSVWTLTDDDIDAIIAGVSGYVGTYTIADEAREQVRRLFDATAARLAELQALRQPVSHPPADATCPDPTCRHATNGHTDEGCMVVLNGDGVCCPCGLPYGQRAGYASLLAWIADGPDEDDELPPELAATLTERQRDGMACVACGVSLDLPGLHCTQVGRVDGGQVFLCAAAHETGGGR